MGGPNKMVAELGGRPLVRIAAEQALASGSPANNPRVPDAAAIRTLYRDAWA